MNQTIRFKIIGMAMLPLLLTGCLKNLDTQSGQDRTSEDYFDFKNDDSAVLSIDYGFSNKDYVVLFEIYDQNPLTSNDQEQTVKKEIEPIYRAATDKEGKFSAQIQKPAHLSKVWLYSEYPGTLSPVELTVSNNTISFDQKQYLAQLRSAKTRAVNEHGYTYPDGWMTLGNWDQYGTPDYLEPERVLPPSSILYNINDVYLSTRKPLKERYPQFFAPGLTSNIQIVKKTKIYMVFINSTAAWNNTVGYYTYPTGKEPQSKAEVQRILAFPNASPYVKTVGGTTTRGALVSGDRVQLKYWDGASYQDEFPAGVTIGWWLEGMAFNTTNGKIEIQGKGNFARFSSDNLNSDGERRTVALLDPESGKIVAIGLEDNIDHLYNDATFYLEITEDGAIDNGNIPTLPEDNDGPSDKDNYVKTEGFVMFEDMWPKAGDYDMNDVIVKYSTKAYKHILNNRVYKIETEYTPHHSGGYLQCSFGINFPNLSLGSVRNVTFGENAKPSAFMEGQMLEPGQKTPTIIFFDNFRSSINKTFTATLELNDVPESSVVVPYNPFIIVSPEKSRGTEVHLVKNIPTDKADQSLFGTYNDGSIPSQGLYYVIDKNNTQYPFALNMPFMQNILIPEEGVKIDDSYPKFRNWVESNGKNNKDWYLYPAQK